jgi:hypothetical protein
MPKEAGMDVAVLGMGRMGRAIAGGDGRLVDHLGPVLASLSRIVRRYDTASRVC